MTISLPLLTRSGSRRAQRLAAVLMLTIGAVSVQAEPRTTQDGVYSKAQAKQGGKIYKQQCQVCHDKKYFRPVLKRWSGQSAAILYDVMAGSMPESNPGGLLPDEYVDLMAYIFSQSRYPAGEQPLKSAALAEITIED
jgi:mono/diheme cytochrome c family protein